MQTLITKLHGWKNDFLHLVYPASCLVCDAELHAGIENICPFCESDLKFTHFENFTEASALDKLFWGRVELESTCAFLNFEQDSSTQNILHAIKYKNKKELATQMGNRFGERLLLNPEKYGSIDALVPVPLHPKKKFVRGYNQSELIADGISSSTKIPVVTNFLTKGVHTKSQTTKTRFLRWDNVSDVFGVHVEHLKNAKHIALVDDVVTTGSTLEACVHKIQQALPEVKVSILSLAIAR